MSDTRDARINLVSKLGNYMETKKTEELYLEDLLFNGSRHNMVKVIQTAFPLAHRQSIANGRLDVITGAHNGIECCRE